MKQRGAMRIIEDRRAPNPRRVRIFLAEKGLSIPFEQLDLMKEEHKTENFKSLNPSLRVPVLVLDDGTAISETMAICRYFEALQPDPPLFGSDARSIAIIEMWNRRMEFELMLPAMQAARHGVPAMAVLEHPQLADWAEVNRSRAAAMFARLDAEFKDRPFLAGEVFSVADITAFVALDFLRVVRLRRPEELVHLNRWHEAVSSRPSAKA